MKGLKEEIDFCTEEKSIPPMFDLDRMGGKNQQRVPYEEEIMIQRPNL
jgi:hypothetical protein